MAFPAFGTQIDCATVNENPQTFFTNQGPPKWELSQHKGGLHGVTIVGNDTKDAARGGTIAALAAQAAGIKMDQGDPVIAVSGRDPQSVFTPIVQKMKADGSNWSLNVASASQALLLRNEATLQGIDPEIGRLGVRVVLRQHDRHRQRRGLRGRDPAARVPALR